MNNLQKIILMILATIGVIIITIKDSDLLLLPSILGSLMNLTAVLVNKGKMPVYYPKASGRYHFPYHKIYKRKKGIKLFFLCDRLPIWRWVFSVGDILLYSGVALATLRLIIKII